MLSPTPIALLLELKKKPVNGSAFGLTIFISLLGACGSGKLKLGAGAWLISGSSTVGAFGGVKSKEIGFFCILFGLIAALISIVTRGSCFCSVLPNPYPEPNPVLKCDEAEYGFTLVANSSYFLLKGETTLSKISVLLEKIPSNGYFCALSPLPLYVPFHLLYI